MTKKNLIKYQGLSTLEVLKEAKNYNKWIANQIETQISSPALEIGAGTGNLTSHLIGTKPFYVTDKDLGLVNDLKKRFANEKKVIVKLLDITKKPNKELTDFFSTVFAINVLEHIEDDEQALKNIRKLLKKNGKLVLLVPAKKIAYTKLDKELGHFRRYEKDELIHKLTNTGYAIELIYFFNIIGLFSWYIRDKVKRKNINMKPYHIRIFDSIVPLLKIIESRLKIPAGISLIVVARKLQYGRR